MISELVQLFSYTTCMNIHAIIYIEIFVIILTNVYYMFI